MAKSPTRRKQQTRETNWTVIGILIAIGLVVFGGLIFLALQPASTADAAQPLADYCAKNPTRCFAQGAEDAPVTMVEVSDFGCPHCRTFHVETAAQLKENFVDPGTVRWVALPYALSTSTLAASVGAMCAGDQGDYFGFADTLFAIEPTEFRISADGIRQAAESIGLDLEQFNSCLESGQNANIINQNREAARDVDVTGTPTFFLNDQQLVGAQPLSAFTQVINSLVNNE